MELGTRKHKRRVFFVRHLAKVPKSTFTAYSVCIVIAAGGLKPVDADAFLFSFEDVFRYDANGLALDLETVTLRFEERAAASKPPLKPNKAMLAKMKSLANHLRTLPLDSCGQDGAEQKMLTHRSQRTWQRSRCRLLRISLRQMMRHARFLSRSVLHEYLFGQKYADEPYASAARFWLKTCTRMDVLEAVSAVCTKKFGNKINQVDGIGASQVYMKIVKFQPQEMRGLYIFPHVVDLVNHDEHYIHATLINWPDYDMLCSNSLGERDDGILLQEVMASTD